MKENTAGTNFEDIAKCNDKGPGVYGMCVRACAGAQNKFLISMLSPRSKYMYIKDGSTADDVVEVIHKQGGKVFGFGIRIAQQYLKY